VILWTEREVAVNDNLFLSFEDKHLYSIGIDFKVCFDVGRYLKSHIDSDDKKTKLFCPKSLEVIKKRLSLQHE
jgi:hypothetical protein